MASARVTRSAVPDRLPPGWLAPVLRAVGDEVARELAAEPFNIARWKYEGIRPRPTRSAAQENWVVTLGQNGRSVEIVNAAKSRGQPYVAFIHYADTPRRPTVLSLTLRARWDRWVTLVERAVARAAAQEAVGA